MVIAGYDLYRAYHPSSVKRGGVCIYYKNFLPLKVIDIQYLQECINFKMKIGEKLCKFIVLYRSPNQSQDELETFPKNFELNFDTILANSPFLTVVLGEFNVKSNLYCRSGKTSYKASKIEDLASQFRLQQLINKQTRHFRNLSSCYIFALQPNLVMKSDVHSSFHENCHHQITYPKFNLKLYLCTSL